MMKQYSMIGRANRILEAQPQIWAAMLIGSWGRKQGRPNSDIDYQIGVSPGFDATACCEALQAGLEGCVHVLHVASKQQIVCYFGDMPKLEVAYLTAKEELLKLFLGSEISQVADSLVFDRTGEVASYLEGELEKKKAAGVDRNALRDIANRFVYEFEKASASHGRSDGYRSYFYYNIALHCAIQLQHYASGQSQYAFLPQRFAVRYEEDMEAFRAFRRLSGSLHLAEINEKKRRLLDCFYEAVGQLALYSPAEREAVEALLEGFFARDFFWNFRDAARLQPQLRKGRLLRASSLTRYQQEPFFKEFIEGWGINKVVDLRDVDEVAKNPYMPDALGLFERIHLPIDPRRQSQEFRERYHYGSGHQIAYRHFAKEHKAQFKRLFEEVNPASDTVLIHCHAGKDRTGVVVALLATLAGASWEEVVSDYEASEMDARIEKLEAFFEVVNEYGGVEGYLAACGIPQETIAHWKKHLRHA
jgi:hypothetical protein